MRAVASRTSGRFCEK